MYNFIIQAIGIMGMILCLICYHFKKRQHMLFAKFIADILWAAHYLLVGGLSGFITNIVCAFRETVYMLEKSQKRMVFWLLFFLSLTWVLVIVSNKGAAGVLPAVASSLATYSFWQKNLSKTKAIALLVAVLMLVYDLFCKSYAGILNECVTIISVVTAILYNKWNNMTNKTIR